MSENGAGAGHNENGGTQFGLLDFAMTLPFEERAFHDGKTAGMKGENPSSPHSGAAEQEWMRGWHEGQTALMSVLDLTKDAMAAEETAKLMSGDEVKRKRGRPRKDAAPASGGDPHDAVPADSFPDADAAAAVR